MEKWTVTMKKADFNLIAKKYNIDPVTARLIRNKDIIEDNDIDRFLNGTLDDMYSPFLMKDMEKAADIILEKVSLKKPIRIIGDYDIDGVMSTYILLTGLTRIGAVADQRIPDRIRDGYGLNEALIDNAASDKTDTIITCDNGISACRQIAHAKSLGMTVIVTDHHDVPFDPASGEQLLPPADAVIDPKQADCKYPFKEICGAVVAWKLVQILYIKAGIPREEFLDMVEFAAIATVGDIVTLLDENRIIVKEGLKQLKTSKNHGLKALISLNDLNPEAIDTYHIGFIIGPCLNAGGRLDSAQKALSLLLSKDSEEALDRAGELINLNSSRKIMTEEYLKKAIEEVENTSVKNDRVLVVYLPDCHESLAGIIAGRIKDRYNRPAFVLTDSEGKVKGSGRSIEEFSMFEEMNRCRDLFLQFGGHPLAAGLSIAPENIDIFRRTINNNCTLTDEDMALKVKIDLMMPIGYISKALLLDFDKLKPFGKGNPRPLFALKNVSVIRPAILGKNRNVVRMQLKDEKGFFMDAVYFGDCEAFMAYAESHQTMNIVYQPYINLFRGTESLQLTVKHYN